MVPPPPLAEEAQDSGRKRENKAIGIPSLAGEQAGEQAHWKPAARMQLTWQGVPRALEKYVPFDPTIPHPETHPTQIPAVAQKDRGTRASRPTKHPR